MSELKQETEQETEQEEDKVHELKGEWKEVEHSEFKERLDEFEEDSIEENASREDGTYVRTFSVKRNGLKAVIAKQESAFCSSRYFIWS